jgi:DNA processing protein
MPLSYQEYPVRQLLPADFPFLLKQIPDPPKKLFLKGEFEFSNERSGGFGASNSAEESTMKFLCIVGPRKYTAYAKEVCEKLIAGLAGYPIVILSGLALGIDGIVHATALDAGLITIAIPGSGLDVEVLYPHSHYQLAYKILTAGGLLISELANNFKATNWTFPSRNRLMAGIAHATLVIEAAERSGTLITADFALQYNRDVLIVPGSIFSPNSSGVHGLMKEGARLVTSSADILQTLGFNIDIDQKSDQNKSNPSENLFFKPRIPPQLLESLSKQERTILEKINFETHSRERLIRESNLGTAELNALLSKLEIKGLIKERGGEFRIECALIG